MISPVTLKNDTTLLEKIQCDQVIDLYKKATGINVSYLQKITAAIQLYRCNESGYFFYTPAETAGDGAFYAELSKQSWYYSLTRWEHTKAVELIPEQGRLLEMGCGSGFFLNLLKEKKPLLQAVGLEINEIAIAEGKSKGLNIINADVVNHAKTHRGEYDFVCSFQVMEHIYNVREVLVAQLDLLKQGGWLMIGVPNNDSYVGRNRHISRCLNMPPHHMGRWSHKLFSYIENEFGLKKTSVFVEPFSEEGYTVCHYNHMLSILKAEWLVKAWFRMRLPRLFKRYFVDRYKKKEPGHTILALLKKESNA